LTLKPSSQATYDPETIYISLYIKPIYRVDPVENRPMTEKGITVNNEE
jgi:hypothetical protein